MAGSNVQDTSPLMMEPTTRPESAALPEVVPVESLHGRPMRHEDSWYAQPQLLSPPSASNSSSNLPQTAITAPYPQSSLYPEVSDTVGLKGFHKTSRRKFALLVALAVFLFTSVALSTGLGIPLAKCRNRLVPSNYAPVTASKVESVRKNDFCDKNGQLTRDSRFTARGGNGHFDLHCGLVFSASLPAYDPATDNGLANGAIQNRIVIVAYSVADCIQACATMNSIAKAGNSSSPPCQSITFLPDMAAELEKNGGNCFIKNATVNDLNLANKDPTAVSAEVQRLRGEQ